MDCLWQDANIIRNSIENRNITSPKLVLRYQVHVSTECWEIVCGVAVIPFQHIKWSKIVRKKTHRDNAKLLVSFFVTLIRTSEYYAYRVAI